MEKHKRGYINPETGLYFWGYKRNRKTPECWMDFDRFKMASERVREYNKSLPLPDNRFRKKGETREDGMVFWSYSKHCFNGENWISRERYEARHAKHVVRQRALGSKRYENPVVRKQKSDYRKANRQKIRTWFTDKYKNDHGFRVVLLARNRINQFLSYRGIKKNSSASKHIGCERHALVSWIEFQFQEGMSWDNRGEWHIDHFLPLAGADSEQELSNRGNYSNLRPLWAGDNLSKADNEPTAKEISNHKAKFETWFALFSTKV